MDIKLKIQKMLEESIDDFRGVVLEIFREVENENECDTRQEYFSGECQEVSMEIYNKLAQRGYDPKFVQGLFFMNADLWKGEEDKTGVPDADLQDHAWVECNGYVIDMTVEQFETEENLKFVIEKKKNCYRYIPDYYERDHKKMLKRACDHFGYGWELLDD
jgi:hypothetical protein